MMLSHEIAGGRGFDPRIVLRSLSDFYHLFIKKNKFIYKKVQIGLKMNIVKTQIFLPANTHIFLPPKYI